MGYGDIRSKMKAVSFFWISARKAFLALVVEISCSVSGEKEGLSSINFKKAGLM